MTPEEGLLDEGLSGSREAMDRLAAIHTPYLQRFIALMGVVDVDDMVQEVLTTAFQTLAAFKRRSKFSSWLLGIALNHCRNWRRSFHAKNSRPSDQVDGPDPRARDRSVLSNLVRKESVELLAAAVGQLPPILQEAFALKFVEDLDYKEVAELLGTSEGTARVRAHRAKALLRSELGNIFTTLLLQQWQEEEGDRKPATGNP